MNLANVRIAFPPSPSDDVVGYRIRVMPRDADIQTMVDDGSFYEYPYSDIGGAVDDDGLVRADLSDLQVMPTTSGVVDLATTAVDRFGNESPPMIIDDAELDFEPPLAPGAGRLEY